MLTDAQPPLLNQYAQPTLHAEALAPPLFFESHVRQLIDQYPEILWFADPQVAHTQAHQDADYHSGWTQSLVKAGILKDSDAGSSRKYIELERMLSSIHAFHLIHSGHAQAYHQLVDVQPPEDRLSRADFDKLHLLARAVAPDDLHFDTVVAALIYSDLGKTPEAKRRLSAALGRAGRADHDDFIHELLSQPASTLDAILPSYQSLSTNTRAVLKRMAQAMSVHLGHVLHLEGGSQMFASFAQAVRDKQVQDDIFNFATLINYCDVAASAAQFNYNGSLNLKHSTYQAYEQVTSTLQEIIAGSSVKQAFNHYLARRAEDLALPCHSADQKIIVRLACQLRLHDKEDARSLSHSFERLTPSARALIREMFTPEQGIDTWLRNPTYVPAVLNNLAKTNAKTSKSLGYNRALEGAACLAHFFKKYEPKLSQHSEPLNCNALAGLANKRPELFNTQIFLKLLSSDSIALDNDGQVHLAGELTGATPKMPEAHRPTP